MPTYWAKAYGGDLAQYVSIEGIKLFDLMPLVAMVAWEYGRAYGSGVRQGLRSVLRSSYWALGLALGETVGLCITNEKMH